eukprot:352836-Chlamydomonas_euryale.AAC.16
MAGSHRQLVPVTLPFQDSTNFFGCDIAAIDGSTVHQAWVESTCCSASSAHPRARTGARTPALGAPLGRHSDPQHVVVKAIVVDAAQQVLELGAGAGLKGCRMEDAKLQWGEGGQMGCESVGEVR